MYFITFDEVPTLLGNFLAVISRFLLKISCRNSQPYFMHAMPFMLFCRYAGKERLLSFINWLSAFSIWSSWQRLRCKIIPKQRFSSPSFSLLCAHTCLICRNRQVACSHGYTRQQLRSTASLNFQYHFNSSLPPESSSLWLYIAYGRVVAGRPRVTLRFSASLLTHTRMTRHSVAYCTVQLHYTAQN